MTIEIKSIIECALEDKWSILWSEERVRVRQHNEGPCEVCGGKEWVNLFRRTQGKFSSDSSSSHFLLGSSSSHSVSGEIDTDKVLSCRSCQNEKLIRTPKSIYEMDIFWDDMWYFYRPMDKKYEDKEEVTQEDLKWLKKIPELYLRFPVETRAYALKNKCYESDYKNVITKWSPKIWEEAGFDFSKYGDLVTEKKFLFFKWKEELTWNDLEFMNNPYKNIKVKGE